MIVINKISVSEALNKIKIGESLKAYEVDFEGKKVEALNVMKLAKAGINVPDEFIYYEDDDIYDPEIDNHEWESTDFDPVKFLNEPISVTLDMEEEIKGWILENGIDTKILLEQLLRSFYASQQLVKKSSKAVI